MVVGLWLVCLQICSCLCLGLVVGTVVYFVVLFDIAVVCCLLIVGLFWFVGSGCVLFAL